MSKYHSKKMVVDGIVFDSRKEGRRYTELLLLQRAGEISNLQRQVEYELLPNQYYVEQRYSESGKKLKNKYTLLERKVCYVADFVYTDKDGKVIVEDTKGFRTKEFVIKRKLMLYIHGIKIKEI